MYLVFRFTAVFESSPECFRMTKIHRKSQLFGPVSFSHMISYAIVSTFLVFKNLEFYTACVSQINFEICK